MTTPTDQTHSSTDADLLTRKLRNAEKSIEFLQNEHSTRLNELHSELTKWQDKYSGESIQSSSRKFFDIVVFLFEDLSFRSAMQNVSDPSVDHRE